MCVMRASRPCMSPRDLYAFCAFVSGSSNSILFKVDTHCPGCDLKCTELNVEGFVHAHFADTAHLKHQGGRCKDSGMSGIVNKATCFETTKPKIDYEHSITRVMCANCHKLDDTDNGI